MERIKHAIEKARAGEPVRARRHGPVSRAPQVTETAAPQPTAKPGQEAVPGEPVAVEYAHTSVLPLDPAHLERNRIISHQRTHPASGVFDVLRTKVLQKMDENGWRTLAITSPTTDSGKTLVAINLALSIAQQSHRTALLVDFDLRRPSVALTMGLNHSASLNDVLEGRADLREALVNPGIERFVVLPTKQAVAGASEVLSSAKVSKLISDVRDRYADRIVIFDLPPVLLADDVMTVLPRIDCVLMVVASGLSTDKEVEEAMLRLSKVNVLGVVLNKDDAPAQQPYAYY